jgi:sugar lactone lactonase YvrE
MLFQIFTLLTAVCSSRLIRDPGTYGPPIEQIHLYYDEWPTGIAVSSIGRLFSNYPPGLDPNNTNNGQNNKYTVAELVTNTTEKPYPSADWNNPPGGQINYTTKPPSGANYPNHLIGVQSVVIDAADRLWILDTGRALTSNGTLVPATYGGPKLVGVDLSNDTVFQTILFPETVAYPDSYLNDIRFDLRASITTASKGVAYITDSSLEGRNGIIIVDLGTGESWRHLDGTAYVRPETGFVPYVWGEPLYSINDQTQEVTTIGFGSDGIALGADGENLFWGAVGSRFMYSAPTSLLRQQGPTSEIMMQAAVQNHGQKGLSDGFETDTNGFIYVGNMEQEGIALYNPANATVASFVRDPRINWVDTSKLKCDMSSWICGD